MILNILINTIAIIVACYLLDGVTIKSYWTALWVAIVLGIINSTLGAILQFLATPFNWLTFGLVGFIINVSMILLVDSLIKGFTIKNFWWGAIFALCISIISSLLYWIF